MKMKSKLAAVCAGLMLAAGSANAGCVKGARAGGVVGHVAGKHGVVGAAVGCAIGHHSDKKKQKEAERQAAAAQQANAAQANAAVKPKK